MTVIETPEYRKLALDSSNDMIRHDSRRGCGEYADAALYMRKAGDARARMGQIMFDEGQFVYAAEDWLSAAACFYLATDPDRMKEYFERVKKLDREGKIPVDRRDIHTALKEREEECQTLDNRLIQFLQEYARKSGPTRESLDFLLRQVRELPGSHKLHTLISLCAKRLGQLTLAAAHLNWAEKFAPGDPHIESIRVSLLLASEDIDRAIQTGRALLARHPEMDELRVLLAQALAFRPGAIKADWEEAIEILKPIEEVGSEDVMDRLVPLALAVTLQRGAGHEQEYRRLLDKFDQLAASIQAPAERTTVIALRQAFPQVFPQPGADGTGLGTEMQPLAESARATLRLVFKRLTTGAAA
jgi:tetratricopeptide (TPR) repeat protein